MDHWPSLKEVCSLMSTESFSAGLYSSLGELDMVYRLEYTPCSGLGEAVG